jgi:hypothetical protein
MKKRGKCLQVNMGCSRPAPRSAVQRRRPGIVAGNSRRASGVEVLQAGRLSLPAAQDVLAVEGQDVGGTATNLSIIGEAV